MAVDLNSKQDALDQLKMEVATELGIDLTRGGTISAKDAGRVGGNMVKRMTEQYKQNNQ